MSDWRRFNFKLFKKDIRRSFFLSFSSFFLYVGAHFIYYIPYSENNGWCECVLLIDNQMIFISAFFNLHNSVHYGI